MGCFKLINRTQCILKTSAATTQKEVHKKLLIFTKLHIYAKLTDLYIDIVQKYEKLALRRAL